MTREARSPSTLCGKMTKVVYFEKFKATKKAVEELKQTMNVHACMKILFKEKNISTDGLGRAEATTFIADGKERILGIQMWIATSIAPDQRL